MNNKKKYINPIMENAPEAIIILDHNGSIIDVNKRAVQYTGYKKAEFLSMTIMELDVNFRDLDKLAKELEKLKKEETIELYSTYRRKDRSIFPVEVNLSSYTVKGETFTIAFVKDISDRKQNEKSIEDSEMIFRMMFETHNAVMLLIEPLTGKIVRANSAAEAFYGYDGKELTSMTIQDINQLQPEEIKEERLNALHEKRNYFVFQHKLSNGEIRTVEVHSKAIDFFGEQILFSIIHDITREKLVQEKLEASEEKYRMLFENMVNGFALHKVITDESGEVVDYVITEMNPAHEKLTGLSKDVAINKSIREFFDVEEEWMKMVGDVAQTGVSKRIEQNVESINKIFDISLISSEKGYFATLLEDITERKKTEYQIKKNLEEKEILLRELYHRTKNNMQVIIALLDLQAMYIDNDFVKEVFQETINRIHAMALVHKMLYDTEDLSRINLKMYILDLVNYLKSDFEIYDKDISLQYNMEDVMVLVDYAVPCGLIINELVTNSFKHGFPAKRNMEIKIDLMRKDENEIILSVADNGIGFPEKFDIESHEKLGLKNIKSLVERQLRGTVLFKSDNGVSCELCFKDKLYKKRI